MSLHSGILDSFLYEANLSCLWDRTPGTKPPHLGCSTALPGLLRKDFKIQTVYKVKEDPRPRHSPLGPDRSGDRTWPLFVSVLVGATSSSQTYGQRYISMSKESQ